jgi:hypothetical protein
MVCKVIADCLEVPNLWTKHAKIDQHRIISIGNHYPDYERNPQVCSISTLSGITTPDKIEIGHIAYCISCGAEQSNPKVLDCCDMDDEDNDDMRTCESCEREIHANDVIWVRDHCYCSDCTSYCEHCQRSYLQENIRWLEDVSMCVCDNCYDEDFVQCHSCDKVLKRDDAHDAADESYCEECFQKQFSSCDDCGEGIVKEELSETVDGRCVCENCYADLTKQATCELVTA